MIQGSNHPRTARNAIGQDTCGRTPLALLIFFPRSRCRSRNTGVERSFWLRWLLGPICQAHSGVTEMIPTEREGAPHQLPMPSHGLVASDLILRPAQGVFDVFVALLDPHA